MRRANSLNIIRTVAIFLVILVHSAEFLYKNNEGEMNKLNNQPVFLIFYTLGRIGVPLFLLLTGYLMLDREDEVYRIEGKRNFYHMYFFPILLKTEIGLLLLIVFDYLCGAPINVYHNLKQLLFLETLPGIQTWYMPIILGIYLFIPFIASGIKNHSNKAIFIVILPIFIYYCFILDINIILQIFGFSELYSQTNFDFLGYYGIYVILGVLIKRKFFADVPNCVLVVISFLSFIILMWIQFISFSKGLNYKIWYNDGLLLLISVPLFIFLERITSTFAFESFQLFSKVSFGIYWVHSMVQILIRPVLPSNFSYGWSVIGLSVANFLISTLVIILVLKMKDFFQSLWHQSSPTQETKRGRRL